MNWRLTVLLVSLLLGTAAAQGRYFLYGGGTYPPDRPVVLSTYLGDRPATDLVLYTVNNPEAVLSLGGPQQFDLTAGLDLSEYLYREVIEVEPNREVRIDLGVLPVGMYLAQLGPADSGSAVMVLVTDLALVSKRDDSSMLLHTAHLLTGQPLQATLHLGTGEDIVETETDESGIRVLNRLNSDQDVEPVWVAAQVGDSWAFSEAYWHRWAADVPSTYLVTDRPVYRAGDTVAIKGTVRAARSLTPLTDTTVTVTVEDADYTEVLSRELTTDSFGSFSLSLTLPESAPLGHYDVVADVAGDRGWAYFRVEEYELPEFEVMVDRQVSHAIHGETVSFAVAAEYLFGSPVAGGTVNYVVLAEPYSPFAWRSATGFYDDYSSTYGGTVIERGEVALGANGQVSIPVSLQPQERDYRLTLQAQVTDEAADPISGAASLIAYRADLVLGVDPGRYAQPVDQPLSLTVTAQDLEGNPLSTTFELSSRHVRWTEDSGRVTEPGPTLSGRTGPDGVANIEIDLERAGSWELEVAATDAAGRSTDTVGTVWLYGGDAIYWDYQYLDVQADRDEYQAGDTARFVIQSPVPDGMALVTREGGRLATWDLVPFSGNTLTYELRVTDENLPNGHLGVTVVGDGEIHHTTVSYLVDPAERFLDITLDFPTDEFEPGSTTELTVSVHDAGGNPVEAQLTLGLVDEAVYLIRPDHTRDIRAFFYAWRGNSVSTSLSTYTYFSQISPIGEAREPMDEAVFAQAKGVPEVAAGPLEEARLREEFRQTIMWLTDLVTDENGRAVTEVTFPDNLTRWRLTARAITRGNQVGQAQTAVTTTLPVIARLAHPDFMVSGDESRVSVIGQNNLSEQLEAVFTLETQGLELSGSARAETLLPPGGRASHHWWLNAPEAAGATLEAEVLTGAASDALRVPLQVVPHGLVRELVWAGDGSEEWEFTLPDSMVGGSLRGTVELTPGLLAAVSPALEWLLSLPHSYTELTVSQLLAAVAADEAGLEVTVPAFGLEQYVREGLEQLYRLQHADGGFGFWRYDTSDPLISAYVVTGLQDLRAAGYEVQEWQLNRAISFLQGAMGKSQFAAYADLPEGEQRMAAADARAFIWLALARSGQEVWQFTELAADPDLSTYGLALSVLALDAMKLEEEANRHLDELLEQQVDRAATASWQSGAPRNFWSDDDVETTALALQALLRLRPDHESVPRIVNWLLLERGGAGWYAGKDTSAVISAALLLEEPAEETGANAADPEAEIPVARLRLNNVVIAEHELNGEPASVDLTGLAVRGRNRLALELPEDETLYASALMRFTDEQEFSSGESAGITVTREYELLSPRWDDAEQRLIYDRSPATSFTEGDFVAVSVTLVPEGVARFIELREPVPAGFTVIEDDRSFRLAGVPRRYGEDYRGWNYWYDFREIRQQRIDYWFARLSEPLTFTYIMRADHPGSFAALPSSARLLYERDVSGHSPAARLTVEPVSDQ